MAARYRGAPRRAIAPANGAAAEVGAVAAVRLDRSGDLLSSLGPCELLQPLVAYVGNLTRLLSRDLALDPFDALHAELVGLRVVVFEDAGELVGLLFEPGARAQMLRRQLGV